MFPLSDFGITGAFNVTNMDFVINEATSDAGSQVVTAKLGTYSGTFTDTTATLTKADISVASGGSKTVTVTDNDPSEDVTYSNSLSGDIVVEIDSASGSNNNDLFFLGANAGGEKPLGFISSTDCSITAPTSVTTALGQESDILITITGVAQ